MKRTKLEIGHDGEARVVTYLTERGHQVLDRNWRVREGEIDIVTLDSRSIIHFIEVKTRSSLAFGHPLESIDSKKAHRLQRLALAWLATHSALGREFQIDVAAVVIDLRGQFTIEFREAVL